MCKPGQTSKQARPRPAVRLTDLAKRPLDAAWIRCPAVRAHQQVAGGLTTGSHLVQELIRQRRITAATDHATKR